GCIDEKEENEEELVINYPPVAILIVSDDIVLVNEPVLFNATNSINEKTGDKYLNNLFYYWDFDDESELIISSESYIKHTFSKNGVYNVKLTIKADDGYESIDNITITVVYQDMGVSA
ncbi:MAG: PKD domain-containing protein, partial [Kosmotogaceae bacterium]